MNKDTLHELFATLPEPKLSSTFDDYLFLKIYIKKQRQKLVRQLGILIFMVLGLMIVFWQKLLFFYDDLSLTYFKPDSYSHLFTLENQAERNAYLVIVALFIVVGILIIFFSKQVERLFDRILMS